MPEFPANLFRRYIPTEHRRLVDRLPLLEDERYSTYLQIDEHSVYCESDGSAVDSFDLLHQVDLVFELSKSDSLLCWLNQNTECSSLKQNIRRYSQKLRSERYGDLRASIRFKLHGELHEGLRQLELKKTFDNLAKRWREETGMMSNPDAVCMHEAYQQIIGMGMDALPFIFVELRDCGGDWYWALNSIVRHDPVPDEAVGDVQEMKRYWLSYAEQNGFLHR